VGCSNARFTDHSSFASTQVTDVILNSTRIGRYTILNPSTNFTYCTVVSNTIIEITVDGVDSVDAVSCSDTTNCMTTVDLKSTSEVSQVKFKIKSFI
jgi:hypothetical protein